MYNSNIVGIMGTLLLWIFISLYVNLVSLKHSLFSFFVGALHQDYQFFETTSFYSGLHIRDENFTVFGFSPVEDKFSQTIF